MFGRGYLKGGDSLAAEYIAYRFKQLTCKPYHESFFQSFSFPINTIIEAKAKTDEQNLQLGREYILNSLSASHKGKYTLLTLPKNLLEDEAKKQWLLTQNLHKTALVFDKNTFNAIAQSNQKDLNQKIRQAPVWVELQPQKLTASVSTLQIPQTTLEVLQNTWDTTAKNIHIQVQTQLKKHTARNVIAYIEGSLQPDSFIVFTAHYDHLGGIGKEVYFPGANDNAAGIAMLFQLADYYRQNPPPYSVLFIAFAGEEAGLIGSKYYTENPFFPLARIKLLLNLDLIGTGDEGMMVVNGAIFPKEYTQLVEINNAKKLLPTIQKRGTAANSDHYFFSAKGVKAFFWYTLGGIKAYHDIDDKPETLPLTKFKEIYQLLIDFAAL
ncbi:MAG: M28 family peptidase [Cytophagales bacterium]|nr:MAG: M28 family peptidase [Cytophagales bacterium]